MDDYKSPLEVPWYLQIENIVNITFNGIEHIGENSFNGAKSLTDFLAKYNGIKFDFTILYERMKNIGELKI